MSAIQELIGWQQLRDVYIGPGTPFEQSLVDEPRLSLVYDPSPSRLGLRLRLTNNRPWVGLGPFQNVNVRTVLLSGTPHVEVLTDAPELFRPIYALISDVLSRMADGESDCLRALELSWGDFEALLSSSAQITREKVVGLFGELWVLRLLLSESVAPLSCWIGADRQSHDFRMGALELEVKTTTSNVRRHVIHGLNQLSPTPGYTLSLVSIRLGSAGSNPGESLNELVEKIRSALRTDPAALRRFNVSLATVGYDSEHTECSIRYVLAAPAIAIDIGVEFPALSHTWLARTLGDSPATRIRDVELTLDLEGLGSQFNAATCLGKK